MFFSFFPALIMAEIGVVHLEEGIFNNAHAFRTTKNAPKTGVSCCEDIHTAVKFLGILDRTDLEFTDVTQENEKNIICGIKRFAYINEGEDRGTVVEYNNYKFYIKDITAITDVNSGMVSFFKKLYDNRNNNKQFILRDLNQTLKDYKKKLSENEKNIKNKENQAFDLFRELFIQYKELTPDLIDSLDLKNRINEIHQENNCALILEIRMLEFIKQEKNLFDLWKTKQKDKEKFDFLRNHKFFQGRSENAIILYSNLGPIYQKIYINLLEDNNITDVEICLLNKIQAPCTARDAVFNEMWQPPQMDLSLEIAQALKRKKNLKSISCHGHSIKLSDLKEIINHNNALKHLTGINFGNYEKNDLQTLDQKIECMTSEKGLPVKFYDIDTMHISLFPIKTTLIVPITQKDLAPFTDLMEYNDQYCGIQRIVLDGQSQVFEFDENIQNFFLSINNLFYKNYKELYLQDMILSFKNFLAITAQTSLQHIKMINIQPESEDELSVFKMWGHNRGLHSFYKNNLLSLA